MIGLILGLIGTLFEEVNNSIFKNKSSSHNILKLGVISTFFGMITFLLFGIYKLVFTDLQVYFNPDSTYLLITRIIFEILQAYFTFLALKTCDRSTFSIIRILTIPLLVIVDIILGYSFTIYSILGIVLITLSFLFFNLNTKTLNFKGWYYILFTAVNAVITLSLFKYSITHYGNSVEVDQFLVLFSILIFFLIYNYKKNKVCALKLIIKEKQFLLQGIAIGLSTLLISYSYLHLNASEATTLKRAGEMLWATIFGFYFFKEKHFIKKLLFAGFIIIGLVIMIT